ncbi:phytoene/squalene synthase family protein [Flavobacterium salilacus subsp. salilacus]|uniref:phytoene/squalene synthase family protein n=1 Tax=Flavobacterium TaxID=237 RepID=UPI0010755ACB|nr:MULTISPECIES: phytoene/squalene synthase family protein [Flavobacterium]KAF2518463.1 phytoene/squalene synthase family protein [Flavobacterium salilacus subsp. salilacus]MBE1615102.1 phytoene/squalene synthase family protein [Flavobacterium sp. SaA2.13]
MKSIFDEISRQCSRNVTKAYSTSFSSAVKMLSPRIRQDIYNIYGFVRFADEIVDTFHDYDKEKLFSLFENDLDNALQDGISLNPVLNAFQHTASKYNIPRELINSFMDSMKMDLYKKDYKSVTEYNDYIYGSADVVGLMCLKVFTGNDNSKYEELKQPAMRLGSAFQKINFLRDLKDDTEGLDRNYFPALNIQEMDDVVKRQIVEEIEADLNEGFKGIIKLPTEAKFGVYTAYVYYKKLLKKMKSTPSVKIKSTRIRVPDYQKLGLLAKCYIDYRFNII